MTDAPRSDHPDLRPRTRAPSERHTPWLMIGGVILLGVLAAVLVLLVLDGGGGDPGASEEPSATAQPSDEASLEPGPSVSVAPSASEAAVASPSAAAAPSVAPADVALDSIVVTTVNGLSVRESPGTGAERLGSLANGTPAFVAGGPIDADGYRWYLVSGLGLPPSTGCAGPFETDPFNCPVWFGWVASGSPDGVAWLAPQEQDCTEEPIDFEEIVIGVTDLMRLACFNSDPFTFRAWWPELPDDAGLGGACAAQEEPSGWLLCQHINYDVVTIDDTQDFGGIGLPVSIDPDSGLSMPERGTWLELTVHLDDPAAQGCDAAAEALDGEEPPEQYVLYCRGQMVVESVTAVEGP